jgi:hypothetical protein
VGPGHAATRITLNTHMGRLSGDAKDVETVKPTFNAIAAQQRCE